MFISHENDIKLRHNVPQNLVDSMVSLHSTGGDNHWTRSRLFVSHPDLQGAKQSGITVPNLLSEYVFVTFPGCKIDLDDLFRGAQDRPVSIAGFSVAGLFPPTGENMTEAFLYLRAQRHVIISLLN